MPHTHPKHPMELVDAERKHLEGLLKDRISFFILFAPVIVGAVYTIDDSRVRAWILLTATVVSVLLALAILRTTRLVGLALNEIRHEHQDQPYVDYYNRIRLPPDANWILIFVPFILSAMLGWLTAVAFLTCERRVPNMPASAAATDSGQERDAAAPSAGGRSMIR